MFHCVDTIIRQRNDRYATTTDDDDEEKWYIIASQVFIPFMVAGFGMVAAGLVLENVKVWATSHFSNGSCL
jgi:hypothetical protein